METKKAQKPKLLSLDSTPNRIRTYDLRIRSALLYPAELSAHFLWEI